MKRDMARLASEDFDLVVLGGGILGAYIAFEASRRGHSVALLERADFGGGTTAGSGKVLHGGLRYLQHLAFGLALETCHEQERLARLAPRLVRPLPFVVQGAGRSPRERLLLRGGAWAWRAARAVTGTGGDLPGARYLNADDTRRTLGSGWGAGTGPALRFHDYQLRSPERLTLALVAEASEMGAAVANYAEAGLTEAMRTSRLEAVTVEDRLTGRTLRISGRVFVNATGAWSRAVLDASGAANPTMRLARGVHAVFDVPEPPAALGVTLESENAGSALGTDRRIFVMPWEGVTLVGATYSPHHDAPAAASPTPGDVSLLASALGDCLADSENLPSRALYAYAGLYPIFDADDPDAETFEASLRPQVLDHGRTGGPRGLVTAVSVKLTSAGGLAERTLAVVEDFLGREGTAPGDPDPLDRATPTPLASEEELPRQQSDDRELMTAMLDESIEREMAVRLSDFVFRRTWLGHLGRPEEEHLRFLAHHMADRLGWDVRRLEGELSTVLERYAAVEAVDRRLEGT